MHSKRRRVWRAALAASLFAGFSAVGSAGQGGPEATAMDVRTSPGLESVMEAFYPIEKRIRDGDTTLRQPLLDMAGRGNDAQTVVGALLLLRNRLAVVEDLRPHRARIFDAMNRLWGGLGTEWATYPFRRELLYRMRHPNAKPEAIPAAEETYIEMLRGNRIWWDANYASEYIDSYHAAFPDQGLALLKRALRDPDRQARQIAFLDLTRRVRLDELATFEPYVDALVESLRSDRLNWHNWAANAEFGAAVLWRIDPFPRAQLAASFTGDDPQGDLVAAAILSVRAPGAVTGAMMAFCADQMKTDEIALNGEIAFHILQSLGERARPALCRALAGNDAQQVALATLALAHAKALPGNPDAERLLSVLVDKNGPVARYAVPEAALILAKRARPWVRRMAAQAAPGTPAARFFTVLSNRGCDHTDIEALFGPQSVAYRRNIPMSHRVAEYLSPAAFDGYLELLKAETLFDGLSRL